jgi:hypothetical protein
VTQIPAEIRPYAEVVVTVADGIAHRPRWTQVVVGTRQVWSEPLGRMVDVPVTDLAWRPGCVPDFGPDQDLPQIWHMGAGWAHHRGHAGCPVCWPDEKE